MVSASDVLVWQGQYYTGTTFNTGTYEFNFSVYDTLTEGNICYSNTTTLTTGNFGEWKTEQSGVSSACSNVSKDYYLNINIDGIDQTPRRRLTIFNYLRKDVNEVTAGDLVLHGVLQGLSPLKLQDEINFIKADGAITSSLYNAPRELTSALPSVFEDSLIHDIIEETNDYGMQECFWDENTKTMQMCISGAYLSGRATTISRSLQIVGNTTNKLINENFTLCEGNNYIDCETDVTGADFLVEDDIEAIGSIFSQENITADDTGFFSWLGSLTNRITKLWVQDIDVSGNINGTGNIETTKNITARRLIISAPFAEDFSIYHDASNYPGFFGSYGDLFFGVSADRKTYLNYYNGDYIDIGQSSNTQTVTLYGNLTITENIESNIIKAGDYYSSDDTVGWTGTCNLSLSTITVKNGLITGCG